MSLDEEEDSTGEYCGSVLARLDEEKGGMEKELHKKLHWEGTNIQT